MKKEYILGLLTLLSGVIFVSLITKGVYTYSIIFGTIFVILLILLGREILSKYYKSSDAFTRKINNTLKTYDAILVRSNIPDLKDHNIIVIDNFEDLVDAQVEIRKPIFFQKQTESCSFILLDQNNALIHVEKLSDDVISPLEIVLSDLAKPRKKEDVDYSILKDIERTTIIKLENSKSYKVSPIRKKEKVNSTVEDLEIL